MLKIQVLNTYQVTDVEITKDKCVTCPYVGKRKTLDTISQCIKCKKNRRYALQTCAFMYTHVYIFQNI